MGPVDLQDTATQFAAQPVHSAAYDETDASDTEMVDADADDLDAAGALVELVRSLWPARAQRDAPQAELFDAHGMLTEVAQLVAGVAGFAARLAVAESDALWLAATYLHAHNAEHVVVIDLSHWEEEEAPLGVGTGITTIDLRLLGLGRGVRTDTGIRRMLCFLTAC
jgi:hypothetical protein